MSEGEAACWLARKRALLAGVDLSAQADSIGRVERIADGVAQVSGLPCARLNELIAFENGVRGFALSLERDEIDVVLLDDGATIEAGAPAWATGQVVVTPVGPGLLGRVVDPLGRPLDRDEPVQALEYRPVERASPGIVDRDHVSEPVETGVLVIDALFALGRGQRELIIGDRATGKTSIALDTIINQKHSDIVCVYVAVGQRATAIERVIEAVRERGAPERCVFVIAAASAAPGLQWIAPFAGFTIAEYFRDRGEHALVVIDDLSKHAATHRELALLTRQPPGREAYPGDVFYVHARMLERAAKLSKALGGGSITALPIAETDAGNLSAYIPTNLISITDGQIVLNSHLFAADQRPAVDVGLSVSRIGGKAQHPVLRQIVGRVRLDYSQFLELEMFTRFGGVSDVRAKSEIIRGERIRALLAQPRFATLRLVDQVALLAALADGAFDDAPVSAVAQIRACIGARLDARAPDVAVALATGAGFEEPLRLRLVAEVRSLVGEIAAAGSLSGAAP